jgi:hypothetical protein
MNAPADNHPALDGKTLDKWFDEGHTPPAPGRPRHARASHARPGWLRSLLNKTALYWQARKGLRARWDARNQAWDAETKRLFDIEEAALVAELAEVVQNAEVAAGPGDPRCTTACPQWREGECDTFCDPRDWPEPEDPLVVLTPEDEADAWVGDLGPAEMAGPEPQKLRDRAESDPLVTSLPAAESTALAAPKRDTAYPEWATGQFAIVDAEIGGAQ